MFMLHISCIAYRILRNVSFSLYAIYYMLQYNVISIYIYVTLYWILYFILDHIALYCLHLFFYTCDICVYTYTHTNVHNSVPTSF